MMMVSENPGTASPKGTDNPAIPDTLVEVVSRVSVVVDVAASVASGSDGVGERNSHPSMKADVANAAILANCNQRPCPSPDAGGWNSGSIVT
jgi:hypothetical protein